MSFCEQSPHVRGLMVAKLNGENVSREELLAAGKRDGLSEAVVDERLASMAHRKALVDAFAASETGQAITAARQQFDASVAAVQAAEARFANDAELDYLRLKQTNAAKEVTELQNANGAEFQKFNAAMEASAVQGFDHLLWANISL